MDEQEWLVGIKAHDLHHSQASVPIGWERIPQYPFVAIVESPHDFLAAYCRCYAEGKKDVAPVVISSSTWKNIIRSKAREFAHHTPR